MIDGKDVPLNPSDFKEGDTERFVPGQIVAVNRTKKRLSGKPVRGHDGKAVKVVEGGWIVESVDPDTGMVTVVSPEGDLEKTYSPSLLAEIQEDARQEVAIGIAVSAIEFANRNKAIPTEVSLVTPGTDAEIDGDSEAGVDPFAGLSEVDKRQVQDCLEYRFMEQRARGRRELDNAEAWRGDLDKGLAALSKSARLAYELVISQESR